MDRNAAPIGWMIVVLSLVGCTAEDDSSRGNRPPGKVSARLTFVDVTEESGIAFHHESGAQGEHYNPETFGPGGGWIDYDGDGWQDILLVNGKRFAAATKSQSSLTLYRNLQNGKFEDVTRKAGLDVSLYGMGFTHADVDNDGDADILIYGLHESLLLINDAGRFRNATATSGLAALSGWVCAAAFLDYDRDGHIDLFAGNYVEWRPELETDLECNLGGPEKKYCPVAMFAATSPQLFRGRGDGTFQETSSKAGMTSLEGKSLGISVEDFDRDGFPDIFVANDSVPNFLLRNNHDGTFEDLGLVAGLATDPDGSALAGMGMDATWMESGALVVAIGNFSGEPTTFHTQEDRNYFIERSLSMPLGRESLDRVTFGLLLRDFDLDGHVDLAQVNGHVYDVKNLTGTPYAQYAQLFRGLPGGTLQASQKLFDRPIIGRALAAADYDHDGDLDLLVTENQADVILLRNDLASARAAFSIRLRGTKSHRDAIGGEVTFHLQGPKGNRRERRTCKSASSYLSQSDRAILFAPRDGESLAFIELRWPSGLRERFARPASREATLTEGQGTDAGDLPDSSIPRSRTSENTVALRKKGVDLLDAGKNEAALRAFESVVRQEPQDFVSHRYRLTTLSRLHRGRPYHSKELESAIQEVVATFPHASILISNFALLFQNSGNLMLGERFFLEATRLDPRRPDAWIALGNLAFDRKHYPDALKRFENAVEANPNSIEALTNIGKIHALQKDYDRAISSLEKVIALRPDLSTALSTLGAVSIARGKYPEAESYLNRALKGARTDSAKLEIYGNLGILHLKRKDWERAAESFRHVLKIDPDDRQARTILQKLNK